MDTGDPPGPTSEVEPAVEMAVDPTPPPPETKLDPATGTNVDTAPEMEEDPTPETKLDLVTETEVDAALEMEVDLTPESKVNPVLETKVDLVPETRVDPMPETKVDPMPETIVDPAIASETKEDPAPETKVVPAPETEVDPAPETEVDPSPEVKVDPAEPAPKSRKRKQATPQQFRPSVEDEPEMNDERLYPSDASIQIEPQSPGSDSLGGLEPVKEVETDAARMLPIHCKVEFAPTNQETGNRGRDDYAIIPSNVKLCDLIRSALMKLGFEEGLEKCAEGSIQLKNWKLLSFSSISDKNDVTVGALFTDILSHLTLNIKIRDNSTDSSDPGASGGVGSPQASGSRVSMFGGAVCEVRRRLLQVLERRGATLLVSHGCPFSQATIGAILQGHYSRHITPSKLQAFYRWFNLYTSLTDYTLESPDQMEPGSSRYRTRFFSLARTLFDPMTEVPKLMRWFKQNPRPSRAELQVYLAELNSSDYRKQGVLLQYSSLAIWFKNARVKYRGHSRERLLGGGRKQLRGTGERRSGNKENQPVDLSQPEYLRNRSPEGGKKEAERGAVAEKVAKDPTPIVPTSSLPSGQPSQAPPVLLVPAPAHFHNGFHQIPPQMLMQPQHMALQQNMAAFPRHGLMGQAPIGMQAHVMVGQTPMAVQPPFPPFLDMRRLPDYATPGGPQPTMVGGQPPMAGQPSMAAGGHPAMAQGHPPVSAMGGQDLTRSIQQLSVPNYTPVNNVTVNGTNGTASSQGGHFTPVVKMEQLDYGDGFYEDDSPEEGEEQHGTTPGVIHEAIPSIVSQSVRSHSNKPTRKRFNIDYAHDLPKLQKWFDANTRPDRDTIERYVDELNVSKFRVGQQEKYTPRVVYVWFKNARAKLLRGQKLSQRWHQLMAGDPAATAEQMNGEMQYDEEES